MNLNFFNPACQSPPITEKRFGLCDNEDNTPAFPKTTAPEEEWIATVKNDEALEVVFTAIDKCVLQDHEFKDRGRCDAMLTTERHLYLIELKNQRASWQTQAKEQLRSTIDFLSDNHDISQYKLKKAFACNKKHRKFAHIDNEEGLAFFRSTGFRLDIQAEIVII